MHRTVMAAIAAALLYATHAAALDLTPLDEPPRRPEMRLMNRAKEAELRALLPQVSDPRIQNVLDDSRLILFTDAEMPPAYQDWSGALRGVHSVHYNISANRSEPFGNGNLEFPWGTPAGTHRSPAVESFRFLWLPVDGRGETLPVVWYRAHLPGDGVAAYRWLFPVDAVLGEVLTLTGPDGKRYTFEVRVRIREEADWGVDVFRPFPTCESLAQRIRALRPDWASDARLVQLVQHLDSPMELTSHTLADRQNVAVFRESMGVDRLPPVGDDRLVVQLLTQTRFESSIGRAWRKGTNAVWAFAPTTDAAFHVVPSQYDGGFIEIDRDSCMRCHETVGEHVNRFNASRDWYGRIRGSDGIFSFHPFEPSSISGNGYGQPVQLRGELTAAGILDRYDPRKHPAPLYQQANGVHP